MKLNHYWWQEAKKCLKMAWNNRNQRTFCYCPVCKQDLCSTDSFVKDTDFVYYDCSRCKTKSKWNFNALAPILIDWKLSRKTMKQS